MRKVLEKVDMVWLVLLAIIFTFNDYVEFSNALSQTAASAISSLFSADLFGMLGSAEAAKSIKFVVNWCEFILLLEIAYLILWTDCNFWFSKYIEKLISKIPEKINKFAQKTILWIVLLTGIIIFKGGWSAIFKLIGYSLPLIKAELDDPDGIFAHVK